MGMYIILPLNMHEGLQKHTFHLAVEGSSLRSTLVQNQYWTSHSQRFSILQGHSKYLPSDYGCEPLPSKTKNKVRIFHQQKKKKKRSYFQISIFSLPHSHPEETVKFWSHEIHRIALHQIHSNGSTEKSNFGDQMQLTIAFFQQTIVGVSFGSRVNLEGQNPIGNSIFLNLQSQKEKNLSSQKNEHNE